jgi:hypothetical protein
MRSRECAGGGAGHGCILGRLGGARAVMVRERAERAREMLPSPPRAAQARVQELYTLTSTKSGHRRRCPDLFHNSSCQPMRSGTRLLSAE